MRQNPRDTVAETIWPPLGPHGEVRIDTPDAQGSGEIVARHPNMFAGYLRNPEAEAESMHEGWVRTGDAGYLTPKGHVVVIDRLKDMAHLRGGLRFSPQYIENKLKFSPYIGEAVVTGHGRDAVAAILCIRFGIVSKLAEKQRIAFTTYTDLSGRPEIREMVRGEVERVNATLPEAQRIARFVQIGRAHV